MNRRGFLSLLGAAPAAAALAPFSATARTMAIGRMSGVPLYVRSAVSLDLGRGAGTVRAAIAQTRDLSPYTYGDLISFQPPGISPAAQDEGRTDHGRNASDDRSVGGAGRERIGADQSEEFVTSIGAGEASDTADDPAPAADQVSRASAIEAARSDQGDGGDAATAVPSQSVEKVAPVATHEGDGPKTATGTDASDPWQAAAAPCSVQASGSNSRERASESRSWPDCPQPQGKQPTGGDSRRDGTPPLVALALAPLLLLAACTDERQTREAAALYGFTEIVIDGWAGGRCGEGDSVATRFHARGVNGACVDGVVCSGFMKGATLRTLGPSNACKVREVGPPAPQSGAR